MDDPQFRAIFVRALKENLGRNSFNIEYNNDAALHIYLIVQACRDYSTPSDALHALSKTTHDFLDGTRAVEILKTCDRQLNSSGTMNPDRLSSVLDAIASLDSHPGSLKIRELVERIKYESEILPSDSLDVHTNLMEIVTRLNEARATGHGPIPPVVRFIVALISKLSGDDALLMMAELDEIITELKLAPSDVLAETTNLLNRPDSRILQITVTDEGQAGKPNYKIDGKLLQVISGDRRDPVPFAHSQGEDIEKAWEQFLFNAEDLRSPIGGNPPVTVEFILPWPLLGCPVERWNINRASDGDYYPVGCLVPVIVRSLERRAYPEYADFIGQWQHRWNMLFGTNSKLPLRSRMAWLHKKENDPLRSVKTKLKIEVDEQGFLTSWLAENKNRDIVGLGLTYAYRPDDGRGSLGLREAFREGIPILFWRRDGGDPDELAALMTTTIYDLKDNMLTWRKAAAPRDSRKVGANIVVMWDDPTDLSPAFSAPQMAIGGN